MGKHKTPAVVAPTGESETSSSSSDSSSSSSSDSGASQQLQKEKKKKVLAPIAKIEKNSKKEKRAEKKLAKGLLNSLEKSEKSLASEKKKKRETKVLNIPPTYARMKKPPNVWNDYTRIHHKRLEELFKSKGKPYDTKSIMSQVSADFALLKKETFDRLASQGKGVDKKSINNELRLWIPKSE